MCIAECSATLKNTVKQFSSNCRVYLKMVIPVIATCWGRRWTESNEKNLPPFVNLRNECGNHHFGSACIPCWPWWRMAYRMNPFDAELKLPISEANFSENRIADEFVPSVTRTKYIQFRIKHELRSTQHIFQNSSKFVLFVLRLTEIKCENNFTNR